jgi:hypothetical protein
MTDQTIRRMIAAIAMLAATLMANQIWIAVGPV